MNRIDDMTHAEILLLDDDQIKDQIQLQCAEEGVIFTFSEPQPPVLATFKRDVEVFTCAGIKSTDEAFIKQLSEFLAEHSDKIVKEDYDYNVGYNDKFIKPDDDPSIGVSSSHFFSESEFVKYRSAIKERNEAKTSYDHDKKEYDDMNKAYSRIESYIWDLVRQHKDQEEEFVRATHDFGEYLSLASGDKEVAARFFIKAWHKRYDKELMERVREYLGLETWPEPPKEEEKEETAA